MIKLFTKGALAAALALTSASFAYAAPSRAAMTCQQFLSLDEITRPKVVYWAEGLNHKGKPEDAVVDINATDRLVPIIVQECRAAPRASFWQKMDAEWRKIEADVKRHV